ncbi:cation channel sperm-associated protein 2 [Hemicordylus capensis]|uniref:cation channel sperm-associated protein 2 n=1 Tax=Hemicordylus capensis TaxID=884348 RepID=UPI002303281D|nr:cation channel sperm-associated protein 2 [Hemicordylus capensis]
MNPPTFKDFSDLKANPAFHVLPRADAIRSKLIYTFYLMDHLRGLSHAVPRHNIQDFLDEKKQRKLMLTDHHQLVRFNVAPIRNIMVTQEKRWRNRIQVRCKHSPPLTMWASWVLNSSLFKGFIIFLICMNMVCLMILSEILERKDWHWLTVKTALEVVVLVIMLIFLIEIGLHWMVSFQDYWKNPWNVFDFTVTMISILPELLYIAYSARHQRIILVLQVFRVLRCLKLFSRVPQIRILIMAITKAVKAMAFIIVLLLFFFYVFAVSGIFFFESYSRSDRKDLEYNMYFKDMPNALVTIFILFTMDHWYALLQDMWKLPDTNTVICGLFITVWLFLGAFIFRNLIVAIMVTNFQNIRTELYEEVQQIETQAQADQFKIELMEGRYSQTHGQQDMPVKSHDLLGSEAGSVFPGTEYPGIVIQDFQPHGLDWETYIHKNLPTLQQADEDEQVVWPRDSLFRYFELLEKLQYNLEERKQLQHYVALALSNLEDK